MKDKEGGMNGPQECGSVATSSGASTSRGRGSTAGRWLQQQHGSMFEASAEGIEGLHMFDPRHVPMQTDPEWAAFDASMQDGAESEAEKAIWRAGLQTAAAGGGEFQMATSSGSGSGSDSEARSASDSSTSNTESSDDSVSSGEEMWNQAKVNEMDVQPPALARPEAQDTRVIPKIECEGSTSSPDLTDAAHASEEFRWDDAIAALKDERLVRRPSRITDRMAAARQVFLEAPTLTRRKGDDKWLTSGGRKGSSERWITAEVGVLKRYGRVVRMRGVPLKFAQYSMLHARVARGGARETFDDKGKVLWVVQAIDGPVGSPHVLSALNVPHGRAVVDILGEPACKFISFRSASLSGFSHEQELGAIVRQGDGVKLSSRQGDFAEYHRRADGEPPFEEGDVVGFTRGLISRSTRRCEMLGIISRKAVIEGSAPPESERHLYDTVAYSGIVPVKVSLSAGTPYMTGCDCPAALEQGQVLAPSGKHDGTAVLVQASGTLGSRVGIVLNDCFEDMSAQAGDTLAANYKLVTAVVVTPTETVRTSESRTVVVRKLALAMIWCMVTVTVAVSLLVRLVVLHADAVLPLAETDCLPLLSTHNISQLLESGYKAQNPHAVSIGDLGLECTVGFSGTPHVEPCQGHRQAFGQVSGCVANNCSIDFDVHVVNADGTRVAMPSNPGYFLGWSVRVVAVNETWQTDPPYLTAAELELTCGQGSTAVGVPKATCKEEHGHFSDFSGCHTTDVCAVARDRRDQTGGDWERSQRCMKRQDQFTLNSAKNREWCLIDDNCEFCTQTALGTYCSF